LKLLETLIISQYIYLPKEENPTQNNLKHNQKRITQLKTWVFASCNSADKLLPPLLTRFGDIHFKPYTEGEFVNIAVEILDREERVDRDVAFSFFNKH